ncbi:MAG: KH domain-containing protein [bacterium]
MQEVLEFILKNITTIPDDIKIEIQEENGTTNYIVTVNPTDVGRIIGKEGKIIKAIRTIMRVIAIQRGVHVRISVVSENGSQDSDTTEQAPETTKEEVVPAEDGSITVEV